MYFQKQDELEYIVINNDAASAKIALQGAHMFHYQRKGEAALLWLSEASEFTHGKAIRGGVPICWPAFGTNNPQLPQHGFARTAMWKFEDVKELSPRATEVRFSLEDSEETRALWAYKFRVELRVVVGDTLVMELKTTNKDTKPFELTQALHTYFAISSIDDVKISGLERKHYLDALTSQQKLQYGMITFDQEVDRVYQGVENAIVLEDRDHRVQIKNEGSKSVVVWNPWIEKCARMSAMVSEAYKEFVCIESANAYDDKRVLESQQQHTLKVEIK